MEQEQATDDEAELHFKPELKSHVINVKRAFSRILRDNGTTEDIAKRAAEMYDNANRKAQTRAGYESACHSGCAFCCCIQVEVSAPEVALLANHLRATLNEDDIEVLKKRMQDVLAARSEGKRPRCPLLNKDETCSVYEIRPIGCRMCSSLDPNECQTYEITGEETPRKYVTLTKLLASYTQAAVYNTLTGRHPTFMPKLELLTELVKAL